jgi:uncharacterized protein involved in outer membrane biogenesis
VATPIRHLLRVFLFVVAALLGALLLGLIPVNVGLLKGPLADVVRGATGLHLVVDGPIILRLGPNPSVDIGKVRYGNTADDTLVEVDTVSGSLSLSAFLRGRIHIREALAEGLRLDYCGPRPRLDDTSDNAEPPPLIAIDHLEIRHAVVGCGNGSEIDSLQVSVERLVASAPDGTDVELHALGIVSDVPFTVKATGGDLNRFLGEDAQFELDTSLESALATVSMQARLGRPFAIDGTVRVEAADLADAVEPFGFELPPVGPLRMEVAVVSDLQHVALRSGAGELGGSQFEFDARIDNAADRPKVRLTGRVPQLDLAPFLSNGPPAPTDDPFELPDADLSPVIRMLEAVDIELELAVLHVSGLPVEVEAVSVAGNLAAGKADVRLLEAAAFGGRLSGTGSFDSNADCPTLTVSLGAEAIALSTLDSLMPPDVRIGGGVESISLEASSCGPSVHAHRDSLAARAELRGGAASYNDTTIPLAAEYLAVSVDPGEPSRGQFEGTLSGVPVTARASAGSVDAVRSGSTWPIELNVNGAGSRLSWNGQGSVSRANSFIEGSLALDAPRAGSLHGWMNLSPEAQLPLHATAQLRLDAAALVAESLAVSAGVSDLRGRIAWHYAKAPGLVEIALRSGRLDLPEIASMFPSAKAGDEGSREVARGQNGDATPGVAVPPVDLDMRLDAVKAHQLDLRDIHVSGRLRDGLIDDGGISLLVEEEIQLDGEFDLDIRRLPATLSLGVAAENLDIGQLARELEVDKDLRMRADDVQLRISTTGQSPREFLENLLLEAELRGFRWLIPQRLPGDTDRTVADIDFTLDELRLATAPDQPTTWSSSGAFDGVSTEFWMQSPSLVDTLNPGGELPLRLVVAANDNVAMFDARIDLTEREALRGLLQVSGAVVDRGARTLSALQAPLPDYQLSSAFVVTGRHLALPDLQMQLGESRASGRIEIVGGERRKIDVSVESPHLQTDDLVYWSRDFRDALSSAGPQNEDDINGGAEEAGRSATRPSRRGILPIAGDFISTLQSRNDLRLSITVDDLHAGISPMGSAELQLFVVEDEFRLTPVRFALPGGGVNAGYTVKVDNGRLDAGLTVSADALSYGGLLRLADSESEAQGLLYLDTEIRTETDMLPGKAPLELLLENANGYVSFAAWPENIEAGILDLWSANLVVALLPVPTGREAARLNCLATNFEIKDGLMKSTSSLLDTTGTIIRGRGTIDLGKEQLDLTVWPQAKREKFLSVSTPVTVTGPFGDFRVGVKPAGFIGTLIRWYTSLIYVPFKWLTGERFAADGTSTCFDAMDWELTPELQAYFLKRDFSAPPASNVSRDR